MKKIGIITFHGSHNYGAMLQAYALQTKCSKMGEDCKIIDFRTPEMINDYAVIKKGKDVRIILKNILQLIKYTPSKRKYDEFERFIRFHMKLTERYSSLEQLKKTPPEMDVYITGSDQIWNGGGKLKDAYFLPFGKIGVRKISYAASIGDTLPKQENETRMAEYLKEMDDISVREGLAANYVKKLTGKTVPVICDPVMLLSQNEWKSICKENNRIKEKYIFCYCIGETGKMQDIVRKMKKLTGLKVVTVSDFVKSQINCDKVYYDVGPSEFLTFIRDADFVITNSFHGTAFAILFQKQFYSVMRKQSSERIENLLSIFGLSERYIASDREVYNSQIDFSNTSKVRNKLEKEAVAFLKRNLN